MRFFTAFRDFCLRWLQNVNPTNTAITANFVTAMLKGKSGGTFTLKGGDANKAGALSCTDIGGRSAIFSVEEIQAA